MHANIGTTDAIYAVLSDRDMQARIAGLGQGGQQVKPDDVEDLLRAALELLKVRKW